MGNRVNPLLAESAPIFSPQEGDARTLKDMKGRAVGHAGSGAAMPGLLGAAGLLLIGFALVDVCLYLSGIADLTGVVWAPLVSAISGALLIGLDGE